jgi:hypothetical protein
MLGHHEINSATHLTENLFGPTVTDAMDPPFAANLFCQIYQENPKNIVALLSFAKIIFEHDINFENYDLVWFESRFKLIKDDAALMQYALSLTRARDKKSVHAGVMHLYSLALRAHLQSMYYYALTIEKMPHMAADQQTAIIWYEKLVKLLSYRRKRALSLSLPPDNLYYNLDIYKDALYQLAIMYIHLPTDEAIAQAKSLEKLFLKLSNPIVDEKRCYILINAWYVAKNAYDSVSVAHERINHWLLQLKNLAAAGSGSAKCDLAYIYGTGIKANNVKIARNLKLHAKYLAQAEQVTDNETVIRLLNLACDNMYNFKKEMATNKQTRELIKAVADENHFVAQYQYARLMFFLGEDEKNLLQKKAYVQEAISYLERSANNAYPKAQLRLVQVWLDMPVGETGFNLSREKILQRADAYIQPILNQAVDDKNFDAKLKQAAFQLSSKIIRELSSLQETSAEPVKIFLPTKAAVIPKVILTKASEVSINEPPELSTKPKIPRLNLPIVGLQCLAALGAHDSVTQRYLSFIVGGMPRNLLAGIVIDNSDIDVITGLPGGMIEHIYDIAPHIYIKNLYRITQQQKPIDIITSPALALTVPPGVTKKAFKDSTMAALREDAFKNRDFTVCALYSNLAGHTYDPTGRGYSDLLNLAAQLKTILPPEICFANDKFRLLRYTYLMGCGFTSGESHELMAKFFGILKECIHKACGAEKNEYLGKLDFDICKNLMSGNAVRSFAALIACGYTQHFMPDLKPAAIQWLNEKFAFTDYLVKQVENDIKNNFASTCKRSSKSFIYGCLVAANLPEVHESLAAEITIVGEGLFVPKDILAKLLANDCAIIRRNLKELWPTEQVQAGLSEQRDRASYAVMSGQLGFNSPPALSALAEPNCLNLDHPRPTKPIL